MKSFIITFLLFVNVILAVASEKQLVTPNVAKELLDQVKADAIVLGNGKQEVHAFLDPLCKMSQRYLKSIYKRNHSMFSKYKIYLHFYEIKSKKSMNHILTIVGAKSKENMMRSIMINKDKVNLFQTQSEDTVASISRVAEVAKQIGVNKRPYIMINGKAK